MSAGRAHSHALCRDGRLFSWGWARHGRLGIGQGLQRLVAETAKRPHHSCSCALSASHASHPSSSLASSLPSSSLRTLPPLFLSPSHASPQLLFCPLGSSSLPSTTLSLISQSPFLPPLVSPPRTFYLSSPSNSSCTSPRSAPLLYLISASPSAVDTLSSEGGEPILSEPRQLSHLSCYRVLAISAGAAHSVALCAQNSLCVSISPPLSLSIPCPLSLSLAPTPAPSVPLPPPLIHLYLLTPPLSPLTSHLLPSPVCAPFEMFPNSPPACPRCPLLLTVSPCQSHPLHGIASPHHYF